jgi:hypothetical protein
MHKNSHCYSKSGYRNYARKIYTQISFMLWLENLKGGDYQNRVGKCGLNLAHERDQ